jgi:hypothetical protein
MGILNSIISLIFEKNTRTKLSSSSEVSSAFAEIQVDATITLDHQMNNAVTSNPIEDGSVVSDSVIRSNRKLTLEGMIVNHPLDEFDFFGIMSLLSQGDRSQNGFEALRKVWKTAQPFKLETNRETYDPVIITDLRVLESAQVGDALRFNMTVEEVIIVQSATVLIPTTSLLDTVQGAASLVKRGKQVATGVSNAVQSKSQSILSSITGLR